MSEEEIIKEIEIIKETQDIMQHNLDIYPPKEDIYKLDTKQLKAVICLLDLYNKEKEKNKELENADLTTVYMNGFYDGEKKWKDKIKQKINEIDDTGIRTFNEQINMELKRIDNQRIEFLQELLEES